MLHDPFVPGLAILEVEDDAGNAHTETGWAVCLNPAAPTFEAGGPVAFVGSQRAAQVLSDLYKGCLLSRLALDRGEDPEVWRPRLECFTLAALALDGTDGPYGAKVHRDFMTALTLLPWEEAGFDFTGAALPPVEVQVVDEGGVTVETLHG